MDSFELQVELSKITHMGQPYEEFWLQATTSCNNAGYIHTGFSPIPTESDLDESRTFTLDLYIAQDMGGDEGSGEHSIEHGEIYLGAFEEPFEVVVRVMEVARADEGDEKAKTTASSSTAREKDKPIEPRG
jgi:hypothetical protein